jgi:hypothetical protein
MSSVTESEPGIRYFVNDLLNKKRTLRNVCSALLSLFTTLADIELHKKYCRGGDRFSELVFGGVGGGPQGLAHAKLALSHGVPALQVSPRVR